MLVGSLSNVKAKNAEVWSGNACPYFSQACGYKIGEIKILELRRKAEKELGTFITLLQRLVVNYLSINYLYKISNTFYFKIFLFLRNISHNSAFHIFDSSPFVTVFYLIKLFSVSNTVATCWPRLVNSFSLRVDTDL